MLNYYFVPIPNVVIDAILATKFQGAQLRILLWVIRKTLGWNEPRVKASVYQIAKDLALDRAGVRRATRDLIRKRVLHSEAGELAVEFNPEGWQTETRIPYPTETPVRHSGDSGLPFRGQESPIHRRAIDTLIDIRQRKRRKTETGVPYHPSGAARPVPGKYGDL